MQHNRMIAYLGVAAVVAAAAMIGYGAPLISLLPLGLVLLCPLMMIFMMRAMSKTTPTKIPRSDNAAPDSSRTFNSPVGQK